MTSRMYRVLSVLARASLGHPAWTTWKFPKHRQLPSRNEPNVKLTTRPIASMSCSLASSSAIMHSPSTDILYHLVYSPSDGSRVCCWPYAAACNEPSSTGFPTFLWRKMPAQHEVDDVYNLARTPSEGIYHPRTQRSGCRAQLDRRAFRHSSHFGP